MEAELHHTIDPITISLPHSYGTPWGVAYGPNHQRMYVTRLGVGYVEPSYPETVENWSLSLSSLFGFTAHGYRIYVPVHTHVAAADDSLRSVKNIEVQTQQRQHLP